MARASLKVKPALSDEETQAEAQAAIKKAVEAMSDQQPMWSRSAYTHRRTTHAIFRNGWEIEERAAMMSPSWPLGKNTVEEAVSSQVSAINAYRKTIDGPALLTWRKEPEVTLREGLYEVYTRLCFEPDLWA